MKIGEDKIGLSWVCNHIVFLEFQIGEKSVIPNSIDDFKCFDVTVPLGHLYEFQKNALKIYLLKKQAHLEAFLFLVL